MANRPNLARPLGSDRNNKPVNTFRKGSMGSDRNNKPVNTFRKGSKVKSAQAGFYRCQALFCCSFCSSRMGGNHRSGAAKLRRKNIRKAGQPIYQLSCLRKGRISISLSLVEKSQEGDLGLRMNSGGGSTIPSPCFPGLVLVSPKRCFLFKR